MKKFRYSMESILQIKVKLEEQMKIAYSIARRNLTKEEEKLQILRQKKLSYENELRRLSSDRLDVLLLNQCRQAIEIIEEQIMRQEAVVRNAQHRLEVARIRLNEAIINRKTHQKLKEKEFEEYMLEYEAEERKVVDELNSYKYSGRGPIGIKEDE